MDTRDHWAFEHRRVVLAVLCTSMFMVVLDNTILSVAIPTITRAFGATSSEIQWVIDAYTLVFAGLLIAGGSFADRFGRRGTLRLGLAVFGAGSIAAAASSSVGMLIGTRAFMGLGAAALMPASLAIISTLFPPGERAFAIGIWAANVVKVVLMSPVQEAAPKRCMPRSANCTISATSSFPRNSSSRDRYCRRWNSRPAVCC